MGCGPRWAVEHSPATRVTFVRGRGGVRGWGVWMPAPGGSLPGGSSLCAPTKGITASCLALASPRSQLLACDTPARAARGRGRGRSAPAATLHQSGRSSSCPQPAGSGMLLLCPQPLLPGCASRCPSLPARRAFDFPFPASDGPSQQRVGNAAPRPTATQSARESAFG